MKAGERFPLASSSPAQALPYRALAVATAIAAYLLVLLGGLVRISGAGLACPDWPLCHGRVVPPLQGPVLVEYLHRLVAASVSVLVGATVVAAVRVRRLVREAVPLAALSLALVLVQVLVGGLTVKLQLTPALVTLHLGVAMLFFAGLCVQAIVALGAPDRIPPVSPTLRRLALAAAAATYVMVLIGGYVSSSAAALACPDLPACRGSLLVPPDAPGQVHMLHRAWALVVTALVLAVLVAAQRTGARPAVRVGGLALGLVLAQLGAGVLNIVTRLSPLAQGLHLALAAALFGALVVLAALVGTGREAVRFRETERTPAFPTIAGGSVDDPVEALPWPPVRVPASTLHALLAAVRDYLALMKPRIVLLLLITTVTTMLVASPHHLSLSTLLLTVLGGALAAGSANAFNMYIDRDIDAMMRRTCLRPVPAGRLRPRQAVAFGILTGVVSIVVMAWGVNLLSAALSTAGLVFYVTVYTLWLKRTTPQNIVIGGAAGAVPPLVGWAAVTGRVDPPALLLFAIVFLWTPPHFWALALAKADDYRAAGVPMLPVVRGEQETRRQIFAYSLALTAATLALYAPLHTLGRVYVGLATVLDLAFAGLAWAVLRTRRREVEMALFGYSVLYLALLFGAMVVDRLLS